MSEDVLLQLAEYAEDVLNTVCPAAATALPEPRATVLRPVVEALLAQAAAQEWVEQQIAQTGMRAMDFRHGMQMELEPARELLPHWVAAARTLLGDAPNYTETKLEMDLRLAESPETYTVVIQRHAPGALTPHEARQKAEARYTNLLRTVSEWCTEANDVGGIDAGDLAWRLQAAGHPLPED